MFWNALALFCLIMGTFGTIGSSFLALKRLYQAFFTGSNYTRMTVDEAAIIFFVIVAAVCFSLLAVWGGTTLGISEIVLPRIQPPVHFGWL